MSNIKFLVAKHYILFSKKRVSINEREKMLLSIIIPIYNLDEYISRCLDSCLSQDDMEDTFEIICVDDGSTDSTKEILNEYAKKDQRIKVLYKLNGGVSSARNYGLENAKGEYVWFVDGDDWIRVNCIKKIKNKLDECSEKPDSVLFEGKSVTQFFNEEIEEHVTFENTRGGVFCFR